MLNDLWAHCRATVYLTVYLFLIARTLKGQVFSVQDLSKASKLVSEIPV